MIQNVVRLGTLIADEWTRQNAGINFDAIRNALEENSDLSAALATHVPDSAGKGSKQVISGMVDLFEAYLISYPIYAIMQSLCTMAGERVLSESIRNIPEGSGVEAILRAAWWADVDPQRGKDALLDAIKNVPKAGFLRTTLANFLMNRVYWSHSDKKDRVDLLHVASEAVRTFGLKLNAGSVSKVVGVEHGLTEKEREKRASRRSAERKARKKDT
jgi:hypothetical protein